MLHQIAHLHTFLLLLTINSYCKVGVSAVFFFKYHQILKWAGIRNLGEQIKNTLDPNNDCDISAKTIDKWVNTPMDQAENMRPTTEAKFQALYALQLLPEMGDSAAWEFNLNGWRYMLSFGVGDAELTPGFRHCDNLLMDVHRWIKQFRDINSAEWSDFFVKNPFFAKYLPITLVDECRSHLQGKTFLDNARHHSVIKAITLTNLALLLESLAWIDAEFVKGTTDNKPISYYLPYIPTASLNDYYPRGLLIKKWVKLFGGSKSAAEKISSPDVVVDDQRSRIDKWIRGSERPRWNTILPLLRTVILHKNPDLPEESMQSAIRSQRILWILSSLLLNMTTALREDDCISDRDLLDAYQRYDYFLNEAKISMGE